MSPSMSPSHENPALRAMPWAAVLAGLCASLVGIGLARFAYTPLLTPLIDEGWFAADQVVYLSAANLGGYLLGAVLARAVGRRFGPVRVLKVTMLLTALSFFACAFPLSNSWFFLWRLLSGVTGGIIMILVAATLMPHIPPRRRGLASGAIFLGLGLGIAGSGTLVPLLLHWGLQATWLGLGAVALALVGLSWSGWPREGGLPASPPPVTAIPAKPGKALTVLYIQYGLMAVGLVPAMMFLADFVARGLGQGVHIGSMFWVLYGGGALLGPMLYGQLGDKLGTGRALRWLVAVQALMLGTLLLTHSLWWVAVVSVVLGTFPPGMVPLVLNRVHDLLPGDHGAQAAAWSRATATFALLQALAGYGYSFLFTASGNNYWLLFACSSGALVGALAVEAASLLKR